MREEEKEASRPRFCPSCGLGGHGISAIADSAELVLGYEGYFWDCHCEECGWSGLISAWEGE